jgi:hypothetical protein
VGDRALLSEAIAIAAGRRATPPAT